MSFNDSALLTIILRTVYRRLSAVSLLPLIYGVTQTSIRSWLSLPTHFMMRNEKGQLEYHSHLITFRHVLGSHSGENLAREFFKIIDEYGIISHKVVCPMTLQPLFNSWDK